MRKLLWLPAFVVLAGTVTGCGGGEKASAEDNQFQKDLAAAAAKNKSSAPSKKNTLTKMPGGAGKPDAVAGNGPATGGN